MAITSPAISRYNSRIMRRKEGGAGHSTVELALGHCYYRAAGPEDGLPLLLIHGATVPGWEFDRLTPLLNEAGFRTYAPDLYGHGKSARPRAVYDYDLFVDQMDEFIHRMANNSPVAVIGHSLGAAIASRLAASSPEKIDRLVLAAPLVDFTATTPSIKLLKVPLLGEALIPLLIKPMLKHRRSFRYCNIEDGRWVDYFFEQLSIPGFGRALLSMVRHDTMGNQYETYARLQNLHHPVQVLRGQADIIMTEDQLNWLRSNLPRASYHEFEDTPHAFLITHPEQVIAPILGFLKSK